MERYFLLSPFAFRLGMAAGIAVTLACVTVMAQPYPSRPVRLVVPASPGGAIDIVGRFVGQRLSEHYHQNFVIDNRAAARHARALRGVEP
jgi:tripartite-type tricarboxylate transporter receptor subunit TctC